MLLGVWGLGQSGVTRQTSYDTLRDERTFVTESWTLVLGKVVGGVSCDGPKRTKKDAPREERLMMRKGI